MAVVLWCMEGTYLQIGGKSTTFATNGKFFSVKKYRVMNIFTGACLSLRGT